MKKSMFFVAASAALMIFATNSAFPQGQTSQPAQPPVARPSIPLWVIDLGFVMDSHPQLQLGGKSLDERLAAEGRIISENQKKIQADFDNAKKSYQPSSPEFTLASEKYTKDMAMLQLDARSREEKIKKDALRLQYRAFSEVRDMVRSLAEANGVAVVYAYQSPTNTLNSIQTKIRTTPVSTGQTPPVVTDEDKMTLELQLNQGANAIYVNPSVDITGHIITQIQKQYPSQVATPGVAPQR